MCVDKPDKLPYIPPRKQLPNMKNRGFIFTTNVMELEGCDPDLVRVWVDAVKDHGVY